MRFPVCGAGRETLLPNLPEEYFQHLNETIECSLEEAQSIYNKFRALAPTGRLTLTNFQECLGLFGTIGRLLAERMFRAFDLNNDDVLDYVEFSSSLLIMTKGTEERKLALSYRIIHPNPQNLPNTIIGSLELSSVESKSPFRSSESATHKSSVDESNAANTQPQEGPKESKGSPVPNEKGEEEDDQSKDRKQLSASSLGFIRMTTQGILNTTKILSSITDMGSDKNARREERMEDEEGIQFGEFVDFVNDIALTKALLVCREPRYYTNEEILKIFQRYASVSREGTKRLTQSDFVNAVCESSEFLEFLGISLSQYAMETVTSNYRAVNVFLQKINATTFGYINRTRMKRKNVYKWMNNVEAKRGLSVHFGHERWNHVVNMMIGLSISARYVYSLPEMELKEDDYTIKLCFDITENFQGLNVNMYLVNTEFPSLRFNNINEYYKHVNKSRRNNRRASSRPSTRQEASPSTKSDPKPEDVGPYVRFDSKTEGSPAVKVDGSSTSRLDINSSRSDKSEVKEDKSEKKLENKESRQSVSVPNGDEVLQTQNHVQNGSNISNADGVKLENETDNAEKEIATERENTEISSSSFNIISNMSNSNLLVSDVDFRFSRFYKDNLNMNAQPVGKVNGELIKSRVLFKEYAPLVFRKIRKISGMSEREYIESVSPEQIVGSMVLGNLSTMSELVSEGKSGALFYYTINGRLILKTVTKACAKFVKRWLRSYYTHLRNSPNSILTRFYGLFSITNVPTAWSSRANTQSVNRKKIYFVVMNNVFYSRVSIHRRFDLKGSWVGRSLHPSELKDPTVALKDVDFEKTGEYLLLGPKGEHFMEVLKRDATFLRDSNLLDYSLLLGVHYRDQSRDKVNWDDDPATLPGDQHRVMAHDKTRIYYVGIVDLLTPWDLVKRVEHAWRVVQTRQHHGVSCVNPEFYCSRFIKFISDHLR